MYERNRRNTVQKKEMCGKEELRRRVGRRTEKRRNVGKGAWDKGIRVCERILRRTRHKE